MRAAATAALRLATSASPSSSSRCVRCLQSLSGGAGAGARRQQLLAARGAAGAAGGGVGELFAWKTTRAAPFRLLSSGGEKQEEAEAKEQGNGAPEEAGEAEVAEGEPEDNVVEELRARITSMDAELKAAKDRVAYALAEMENVRNIARRDAESGRKFAVQSFAKSLLDVADNLEMAIAAVPEEEASSPGVATLLEGVKMTESNLQKTFAKQGLVRFGVVGDKFDPHLHDAMFTYEDASAEKGTVGQVLKPGYQLHDRVIRAAQVGIIKE